MKLKFNPLLPEGFNQVADRVSDIRYLEDYLGIRAMASVATTEAITLSGEQTIDSEAVVDGDLVLVWRQNGDNGPHVDNGVYIVRTGAWERWEYMDDPHEPPFMSRIFVMAGSIYGGMFFLYQFTGEFGVDPISYFIESGWLSGTSKPMFIADQESLGFDLTGTSPGGAFCGTTVTGGTGSLVNSFEDAVNRSHTGIEVEKNGASVVKFHPGALGPPVPDAAAGFGFKFDDTIQGANFFSVANYDVSTGSAITGFRVFIDGYMFGDSSDGFSSNPLVKMNIPTTGSNGVRTIDFPSKGNIRAGGRQATLCLDDGTPAPWFAINEDNLTGQAQLGFSVGSEVVGIITTDLTNSQDRAQIIMSHGEWGFGSFSGPPSSPVLEGMGARFTNDATESNSVIQFLYGNGGTQAYPFQFTPDGTIRMWDGVSGGTTYPLVLEVGTKTDTRTIDFPDDSGTVILDSTIGSTIANVGLQAVLTNDDTATDRDMILKDAVGSDIFSVDASTPVVNIGEDTPANLDMHGNEIDNCTAVNPTSPLRIGKTSNPTSFFIDPWVVDYQTSMWAEDNTTGSAIGFTINANETEIKTSLLDPSWTPPAPPDPAYPSTASTNSPSTAITWNGSNYVWNNYGLKWEGDEYDNAFFPPATKPVMLFPGGFNGPMQVEGNVTNVVIPHYHDHVFRTDLTTGSNYSLNIPAPTVGDAAYIPGVDNSFIDITTAPWNTYLDTGETYSSIIKMHSPDEDWEEVSSLVGQGTNKVYTITYEVDGSVTLQFGDGSTTGAIPPTDNEFEFNCYYGDIFAHVVKEYLANGQNENNKLYIGVLDYMGAQLNLLANNISFFAEGGGGPTWTEVFGPVYTPPTSVGGAFTYESLGVYDYVAPDQSEVWSDLKTQTLKLVRGIEVYEGSAAWRFIPDDQDANAGGVYWDFDPQVGSSVGINIGDENFNGKFSLYNGRTGGDLYEYLNCTVTESGGNNLYRMDLGKDGGSDNVEFVVWNNSGTRLFRVRGDSDPQFFRTVDMSTNIIRGVDTPTDGDHAANKQYVDDQLSGVVNTYTNGTTGATSGTTQIDSFDITTFSDTRGCKIMYTLEQTSGGTGIVAGELLLAWQDGVASSVVYNQIETPHIGDASGAGITVTDDGNYITINIVVTSGTWTARTSRVHI